MRLEPTPHNTLKLRIDVEHLHADVLATFERIRDEVVNGDQGLATRIHARAVLVNTATAPGTNNAHVLGAITNAVATHD